MNPTSPFPPRRTIQARRGFVWCQVALAAFSLNRVIAADGPIGSVQEALRREHFLAAEPSGVLDETTRNALKRFQTQRHLPVTGEIDSATLQALQASAEKSTPAVQALPPTPKAPEPSKAIIAKDRAFLDGLQQAESQAVEVEAPAVVSSAPAVKPPLAPQPPDVAVQQSVPPVPEPAHAATATIQQTVPPARAAQPKREVVVSPPESKPTVTITEPKVTGIRQVEEPHATAKARPRKSTSKIARADRNNPPIPPVEPTEVTSGPRPSADARTADAETRDFDNHDERNPIKLRRNQTTRTTVRVTESENDPVDFQGARKVYVGRLVEPVEIRRAVRVEHRERGFFHRLFNDDAD